MTPTAKQKLDKEAKILICAFVFIVACTISMGVLGAKYFKMSEFEDRETGAVHMDADFLEKLGMLRELCGFPFHINSGYRGPRHSIETAKVTPGTHSKGIAVDIRTFNINEKNSILKHAISLGFTGIGIYPGHIHLDRRKGEMVLWVGKYRNRP